MYDRTPPKGLAKHLVYQAAGVGAFLVYISAEVSLFEKLRPVGGRGRLFLLTFVLAVLFWWWSTYMLLYRQVPLRQVFPAGVATGVRITGLGVALVVLFGPDHVGEDSYGPAGVVIALINFLIGFGVCLHAGAIFGRMWNEWRTELALCPLSRSQRRRREVQDLDCGKHEQAGSQTTRPQRTPASGK